MSNVDNSSLKFALKLSIDIVSIEDSPRLHRRLSSNFLYMLKLLSTETLFTGMPKHLIANFDNLGKCGIRVDQNFTNLVFSGTVIFEPKYCL